MKPNAFFIVALLASPGFAAAQPAPAPTVVVHYADLDLGSPTGARAMLIRIRKAAADACRDSPGMAGNDADTVRRLDECFHQSVERAVEGLNAPLVTAAHRPAAPDRRFARLP